MRDTKYARELASVSKRFPNGSEARIERLFVKKQGEEEIRFSWWHDGRMIPRPLDVPERDLIELLRSAIERDVFSTGFLAELKALL